MDSSSLRLSSSSSSQSSSMSFLVVDFFMGQAGVLAKWSFPSHWKHSLFLAGHLCGSCRLLQLLHLSAFSLAPCVDLTLMEGSFFLTLYFPLFFSLRIVRSAIALSISSSDSSLSLSSCLASLLTLLPPVAPFPWRASAVAFEVSLVEPVLMRVLRVYCSANAFSARLRSFIPASAATLIESSLVNGLVSS